MSEVNPASEQARADQIVAQAKKRSPINKGRIIQSGMQGTSRQAIPTNQVQKSPFDQVMENVKTNDPVMPPTMPVETGFESHLVQVREQEDSGQSFSEDFREDGDDHKVKEDHKKGETLSETKGATKTRVQAKAGLKSQSQGSDSGQQEQKGKSPIENLPEGPNELANLKQKKLERLVAPSAAQTGWAPGVQQVAEAQAVETPQNLPKALLDQIVQSVTILKRKDLDPEMTIDFHDSFFNGLKLKVSGKDKALRIEFVVPNRAVEQTFRQEKDEIAAALGAKGIEVRSMEIRLG